MISWATSIDAIEEEPESVPAPAVSYAAGSLRVVLVLLNNSGIGGAERRFAQVYRRLRRRGLSISLVINRSLLKRLRQSGLLADEVPALVLSEPFGEMADSWAAWRQASRVKGSREVTDRENGTLGPEGQKPVSGGLGFLWRKTDYLLSCVVLLRWLARQRPQVMHLVLGGAYVALPAQWLSRAPATVLSVVCPSLRDMVGARAGYWLYRMALKRATAVDALTEDIAAMLQREGVSENRIRISSGSCVDTERFRPASNRQPWVVFSGRLVEEKNPALFVEACSIIRDRFPEARFLLFGDGPLREAIETLIRARGLQDRMEIGWSGSIETVLREARIFVSLQRMDNYPSQALLEAMACGLAVVATDVGSTWKLVDDAVGFRVQPTPAAVAAAILTLLQDSALAASLGRRARDRVVGIHSMDAYADYLEGVYEGSLRCCSLR